MEKKMKQNKQKSQNSESKGLNVCCQPKCRQMPKTPTTTTTTCHNFRSGCNIVKVSALNGVNVSAIFGNNKRFASKLKITKIPCQKGSKRMFAAN